MPGRAKQGCRPVDDALPPLSGVQRGMSEQLLKSQLAAFELSFFGLGSSSPNSTCMQGAPVSINGRAAPAGVEIANASLPSDRRVQDHWATLSCLPTRGYISWLCLLWTCRRRGVLAS